MGSGSLQFFFIGRGFEKLRSEGGDFFQNRRLDLDSALAAGVGSPLTLLPFYLFSENLS